MGSDSCLIKADIKVFLTVISEVLFLGSDAPVRHESKKFHFPLHELGPVWVILFINIMVVRTAKVFIPLVFTHIVALQPEIFKYVF